VGTTVTSWILSLGGIEGSNLFVQLLKPTSFTPVLALIGIIFYMFLKSSKKKDTGMILLGFATLMFGMETMSGAVEGLKDVPAFQQLFLLNYHMWQSRRRNIPMPADMELMRAIRANNTYALKELKANIGRWNGPRLFKILGYLREYDAKSKGVDSGGLDGGELLKELLLKIFMS
jgi:hypothetical protein